jgi:hypothetical protein
MLVVVVAVFAVGSSLLALRGPQTAPRHSWSVASLLRG